MKKTLLSMDFGLAAEYYDSYAIVQQQIANYMANILKQLDCVNLALDLGAGTGSLARHIKAHRKIAIDIAPKMCQILAQRAKYNNVICADIESLPFANHAVDLAISSLAIQWTDPNLAIKEIARVLRKNSRALIAVFVKGTLAELNQSLIAIKLENKVVYLPSADLMRYLFANHGLKILRNFGGLYRQKYDTIGDLLHAISYIGASNKQRSNHLPFTKGNFSSLKNHYNQNFGNSASWQYEIFEVMTDG